MKSTKQNKARGTTVHGAKKLGWTVALIAAFGIVASGCGQSNLDKASSSASPAASTQPAEASAAASEAPAASPEPSGPKEFAINEPAANDTYKITVTDFKKRTGGEYSTPKRGNVFVVVTVKIENIGTEQISYNALDFKLQDSNGSVKDSDYHTDINGDSALESGELAAGGKVSGTLIFEAPKNDPKLQLQYAPNFDNTPIALFNIK